MIAKVNQEPKVEEPTLELQTKVSALSLASIKAKRELSEQQKSISKEEIHLPNEPFTETQMLEQWFKYAQRLEDKGQKIMAALLRLKDSRLEGTTIIHELSNESSKIDFESDNELLGYLRGKLHNHDITIEIQINEKMDIQSHYSAVEKYNHLLEINPLLDVLKSTFDLSIED